MLALYRSGRASEALEAYAGHARVLDDELGLVPGAEVRELQTGDPAPGARTGGVAAAAGVDGRRRGGYANRVDDPAGTGVGSSPAVGADRPRA